MTMTPEAAAGTAHRYLAGMALTFNDANTVWRALKSADDLSLARRVLARLRAGVGLIDDIPADIAIRQKLAQQEALLTSKDCEFSAAMRHDQALRILTREFGDLDDVKVEQTQETLGIAGGIRKRRFDDLGQPEDLRRAARYYERGAEGELGEDGYLQINAAFMDDVLAGIGDQAEVRRSRAASMRQRILDGLPALATVSAGSAWFNTATRAEALFGLRRYAEATQVLAESAVKPEPWELQTTARQIATLAHIHESDPLAVPDIRHFFDALLPGAVDAARSAVIGKVGLALSGGGFRASFYHLGVLAWLAELNVLRHVDVLSCVSGGSIVGACYWVALKNRLQQGPPMGREDYVALVQDLIEHFFTAVQGNLRGAVQPGLAKVAWNLLRNDQKGALDPALTADALDRLFYAPLRNDPKAGSMHDLPFTPADHGGPVADQPFHPGRHNWLRANKVPVLVLNATTVNTGHAWQFTPTWMGESPWAVHEAADSIPRLEWHWYEKDEGWSMPLSRAVAASACVPGVFAPLEIDAAYDGIDVQLVDGGVHDNQGTVSLLALNCNVVLVSDACGQLLLEKQTGTGLGGLLGFANRSMSTLMERVRLANYADLSARQRSGLLRGLMFLHMKAGLDANTIPLTFSQESSQVVREQLSPSGVRKDFQQALAELRTDLDAFTADEADALMACGYRMARWAFKRDLASHKALFDEPKPASWRFATMLEELTSTAVSTPRRKALLKAFREGSSVRL